MADKIRVLIADDYQVAREGLKLILSADPEVAVVGEAASGEEAVAKVGEVSPDLVLMDALMPGMGGIEATRRIRTLYPPVAVVVLAAVSDEVRTAEAMVSGAAGYLLKDASPDQILQTVHAVRQGMTAVDRRLVEPSLGLDKDGDGTRRVPPSKRGRALTPRERDILSLIVEGKANKEIASALSIAEDTVKKHVQSIISKLGVADRTQAAVKALRTGLVN